jgi:ubiquinone/menaquinone biosynthesis C-methylase UbiE
VERSRGLRSLFDVWSRVYDWPPIQRVSYRPVHDAVIQALPARPSLQVLDVGCGTGLLTRRVASSLPVARVIGCDSSSGMLRQAARQHSPVAWVQGDAMRLPLRSASCDALLCTESFHWYPDQGAALTEFARVVAPGGVVLISIDRPPPGALAAARTSRADRRSIHWVSLDQVRRLADAVGLQVVSQRRVIRLPGLLLFPTYLVVCNRT